MQVIFYFFIALLLTTPFCVTVLEIVFAVKTIRGRQFTPGLLLLDMIGFIMAATGISFLTEMVRSGADWDVQIYENVLHNFLSSEHRMSFYVMLIAAFCCYLFLSLAPVKKLPPLLKVIALSGTYLFTILGIVFVIQIMQLDFNGIKSRISSGYSDIAFPWLLAIILSLLAIGARTTFHVIHASSELQEKEKLPRLRRFLQKSSLWPVFALILLFPLVGILAMILFLFGQAPDAVIRAFTETADWTFSTKIPPQSLFYDEHYLCTVAAGGHQKIVKPLRMGLRHGHPVVVNRQLQVANAFEQILEERTPRLHKAVRSFYDRFGFPFARLIHTKTGADIIYFVMKPLEWIFLIVLYLCDVNPENRIAMQYTGKKGAALLQKNLH